MAMTYKNWRIQELTGYQPITTFYMDFSIADRFGISAIKDTYRRAFKEWKSNYKYLTELVMVLNWKTWEHYEQDDTKAQLYQDLFETARSYALDNLEGEELSYYIRTTD